MSEQRDAAADLREMSKLSMRGGFVAIEIFLTEALPHWIARATAAEAEADRLGIQITGMEIQMHALRAALEAYEDEEL